MFLKTKTEQIILICLVPLFHDSLHGKYFCPWKILVLICAWQLLKSSRTILNGYFQQVSFIFLKNSVESTSFIVFSSWFYHFPFLFFILRIARFTKEEFTIKPVRLAHTLRSHHMVPPKDPGSHFSGMPWSKESVLCG